MRRGRSREILNGDKKLVKLFPTPGKMFENHQKKYAQAMRKGREREREREKDDNESKKEVGGNSVKSR